MNKKCFLILFFSVFFAGVHISAQTKKEKKEQKEALEIQKFEEIQKLIESKSYEYEADWANAQGGRRISLVTNSNYIRIKGDSIFAEMPYFGVVRGGGAGYNEGGGIKIKNKIEEFSIEINEKKKKILLKFSAKGNSDNYDFIVNVFNSGSGRVNVLSSYKSPIVYDGYFSEIKKEKEKSE